MESALLLKNDFLPRKTQKARKKYVKTDMLSPAVINFRVFRAFRGKN